MSNIYYYIYYFIVYSFLGWCLEIIYAAKSQKKFVNRGFLHGPFCPMYGFAALIVILSLNSQRNNLIFLFIASTILASILEYFTGFILEKAFKTTWWDYSDDPFNLKGRICLGFSLLWGGVAVLLLDVVHPIVSYSIHIIPNKFKLPILFALMIYLLIDLIVTLITLIEFRVLLTKLNSITVEIMMKLANLKEAAGDKLEIVTKSTQELKQKYENILSKYAPKHARLIKAFPNLRSKKFYIELTDITNKIINYRKKDL